MIYSRIFTVKINPMAFHTNYIYSIGLLHTQAYAFQEVVFLLDGILSDSCNNPRLATSHMLVILPFFQLISENWHETTRERKSGFVQLTKLADSPSNF